MTHSWDQYQRKVEAARQQQQQQGESGEPFEGGPDDPEMRTGD